MTIKKLASGALFVLSAIPIAVGLVGAFLLYAGMTTTDYINDLREKLKGE